ncbi:permease prefix domain 1-containing protein [Siminovitchia fortis]|uniref:Uncharacterized protein n=1 Tax=Siminovitchia fortis TaxID=254758 RepID=A0A443IYH0_9BACI|nr:permease prefix domain 1-containing protein [Siminovitchia fortis]RWR13188.1 hypothetical protein D4N35_005300 [Siminovitchia fortis]WHY82029.1 permease prefix domain 1-containing protein [Siminovitchia fortis]
MNKKVKTYVEDLFRGYEETAELQDFKEEIISNLLERIKDFETEGMDYDAAFTKAIGELGDITAIADDISRQKRNEVIGQMYFQHKVEVGLKHAIGYVIAGILFLFGLTVGFITYFSTDVISEGISSSLPFIVISGAAFVFLGLTQETASDYPMSWGRALIYAIAAGGILFGLITAASLYFMDNMGIHAVLGTLLPFVIPGVGILAFLLLTEKSRHKPWVIEEQKIWTERYMKKDPQRMAQGGLLSGALWVFAIAMVILAGFKLGIIYAVVVFLTAIALQLFIEFWVQGKSYD